ncbi:MAG TPA: hypothetical protein PKD98_17275 [Anaerolineae bacterium]|nr:hypothetical protein [Anaerolineae bacterium]
MARGGWLIGFEQHLAVDAPQGAEGDDLSQENRRPNQDIRLDKSSPT